MVPGNYKRLRTAVVGPHMHSNLSSPGTVTMHQMVAMVICFVFVIIVTVTIFIYR